MRVGGNRMRAACPAGKMRGAKSRRYVEGSADVQMPISMTASAAAVLAKMLAGMYDGGARMKSVPVALNPLIVSSVITSIPFRNGRRFEYRGLHPHWSHFSNPKKSPQHAGIG
ncbi:hypothetical protein D3C87_1851740 [compost metagenome]